MGFSDVIPGVSGGTMALITGIYESLIKNIHEFFETLRKFKFDFSKKNLKKTIAEMHFSFFALLIPGIGLGILCGAFIINKFLISYKPSIYGLFSGLILCSVFLLLKKHRTSTAKLFFWLLLGVFKGVLLSFISSSQTVAPSFIGIGLAGFLSVTAMILPGISGAMILVMLGKYEFMIQTLNNPLQYWPFILLFMLGGLISLILNTRIIKYLLTNHKKETIHVLIGLMIGALMNTMVHAFEKPELGMPFFVLGFLFFWLAFKNQSL